MRHCVVMFKPISNKKILDLSKLRALAENKMSVPGNLKFVFSKGRKHCAERRNVGYQHFLFLLQCVKVFFSRVFKTWDYVVKS